MRKLFTNIRYIAYMTRAKFVYSANLNYDTEDTCEWMHKHDRSVVDAQVKSGMIFWHALLCQLDKHNFTCVPR
jgi:hypothetical protein